MATYKTPGVYVEEISLLPRSVAQVETAIPAFIGYTQFSEKDGQPLKNVPTRITSMLEYQLYFGGARSYAANDFELRLDENNGFKVQAGTFKVTKLLNMYNSLRQYFDNGGGPCYIVSVGSYADTIAAGDENDANSSGLRVGLKALEKYDEPTVIVIPDAANLNDNDFYALQQMAIAQAGLLQDRVAVLDLREYDGTSGNTYYQKYIPASQMNNVYQEFRNRIGINDLKYAAAYTPWVVSSYAPNIPYAVFKGNVKASGGAAIDFTKMTAEPALNTLVQKMEDANGDLTKVIDRINAQLGGAPTLNDRYIQLKNTLRNTADATSATTDFNALMDFIRNVANEIPKLKGANQFVNPQLQNDLDTYAKDSSAGLAGTLKALLGFENNAAIKAPALADAYDYTAYDAAAVKPWWQVFPASDFDPNNTVIANFKSNTKTYPGGDNKAIALSTLNDLDAIFKGLSAFMEKVKTSATKYAVSNQNLLYTTHPIIAAAVTALQRNLSILPPSSAVAGVYAKTDRDRGVWKAPANVSLSSVVGPTVMIDNTTQDGLNVDTEAGKSINAIRAFSGKGTLVWGARTLDGNSNEWRYISVRRFFNMVEESVKKSTYPFVFEPNDANTWVKVKGMIENYLTTLWRQGALAGAKPEHAFFVRVGLNQTMTALDILEGRMNVEIGMAAVRPAEFIILKFSHKMQES
jgi:phage tail sheath protein FI